MYMVKCGMIGINIRKIELISYIHIVIFSYIHIVIFSYINLNGMSKAPDVCTILNMTFDNIKLYIKF